MAVCPCGWEGGESVFPSGSLLLLLLRPSARLSRFCPHLLRGGSASLSLPVLALPLPFSLGVPYPQPLPLTPPFRVCEAQRESEESGSAKPLEVKCGLCALFQPQPQAPRPETGRESTGPRWRALALLPLTNLGSQKLLGPGGPCSFGPLPSFLSKMERAGGLTFPRFSRRSRTTGGLVLGVGVEVLQKSSHAHGFQGPSQGG